MSNYKVHKSSKHSVLHGFCSLCLESSKFRHCLVDGKNSIVCVICKGAKPLYKGIDFPEYMINKKMTPYLIFKRLFKRALNPKRTYKILKHRNFILRNLRRLL